MPFSHVSSGTLKKKLNHPNSVWVVMDAQERSNSTAELIIVLDESSQCKESCCFLNEQSGEEAKNVLYLHLPFSLGDIRLPIWHYHHWSNQSESLARCNPIDAWITDPKTIRK